VTGSPCQRTDFRARIEITPLRRGDLPRCAELERLLFPGDDPWRAEVFAAELDQGHHYVAARLAAVEHEDGTPGAISGDSGAGRLIGYAGLAILGRPPDQEADVHTIGVDPEHQHRGVGRRLLRALLAHADARGAATYLEVRTDNRPAIELYRSEGFEVLGVRRRYYQPSGADAYTMRRAPGPPYPAPWGAPPQDVKEAR
jgi:ribosomal-protein-alanine N-acetyltransferase